MGIYKVSAVVEVKCGVKLRS